MIWGVLTDVTAGVDLMDGRFYASRQARDAYRWMREHQPVFRNRNGMAAAATYRAVIDVEWQPELFSNAGGIRPTTPALPHMIDMDDPSHLLRRKLVNAGFTRKRVQAKANSIPNNHVSFGFGTHFCLGNQLARLELTAMTRRVLARLPDLRLADGAELPLRPANFVSGLEAMPVEFTPTAPIYS